MRDLFRLLTTMVIWGAFTTVVAIMFTSATGPIANVGGAELIIIIAIMALIAASMTRAMWREASGSAPADEGAFGGKRKRSDSARLARLLEQLDDETVRDLEVLLAAQRTDARDAEER